MPRGQEDSGQTTLLIVGLAVVLMMAIAVVVDATAAYLQRQGLATVADGAALAEPTPAPATSQTSTPTA